jgi:ArsR family transcriptional regulator, arsenate/arsenite/antimonite-responsive transcriptional repressor
MLNEKAKIFKALSDPNRLRIIKMLSEKDLCVCEIKVALKLAGSTVSQHLSVLKDSGFISEEKNGKWVNYRINTENKNPVILSLLTLLNYELAHDKTIQTDLQIIKSIDRKDIC